MQTQHEFRALGWGGGIEVPVWAPAEPRAAHSGTPRPWGVPRGPRVGSAHPRAQKPSLSAGRRRLRIEPAPAAAACSRRAGAGSEPAGCPGGGPAPGGCTERPWQGPARLPRSRVPRAARTARRPGAAALSELQRFATSSAPPASSKAPAAPSRARPWPAGGGAGCPGELRGERSPHSAWGSRSAPCPLRASGPGQGSAVRVPHLPLGALGAIAVTEPNRPGTGDALGPEPALQRVRLQRDLLRMQPAELL